MSLLFLLSGTNIAHMELGCLNVNHPNASLAPVLDTKLSDLVSKKKELRNLKSTDYTWKVYIDPKGIKDTPSVVVKKAEINEDSKRYKRVTKEIRFYRKVKGIRKLRTFLPNYYGCVTYDKNIYMIIEFFKDSIQKYVKEEGKGDKSLGYKKFQLSKGDDQLNFFTQTAAIFEELHSQGFAITNMYSSNILIREENGILSPVLISFGYIQTFDSYLLGKVSDIHKELLAHDKKEIAKYTFEHQKEQQIKLEPINLPKFDIIRFAYLIYQTDTLKPNGVYPSEFTEKFQKLMKYINLEETYSKRKLIQESNFQTEDFIALLTEMTKSVELMTITFNEVVRCLTQKISPKRLWDQSRKEENDINVFKRDTNSAIFVESSKKRKLNEGETDIYKKMDHEQFKNPLDQNEDEYFDYFYNDFSKSEEHHSIVAKNISSDIKDD